MFLIYSYSKQVLDQDAGYIKQDGKESCRTSKARVTFTGFSVIPGILTCRSCFPLLMGKSLQGHLKLCTDIFQTLLTLDTDEIIIPMIRFIYAPLLSPGLLCLSFIEFIPFGLLKVPWS